MSENNAFLSSFSCSYQKCQIVLINKNLIKTLPQIESYNKPANDLDVVKVALKARPPKTIGPL
jgi:hypothetical protein